MNSIKIDTETLNNKIIEIRKEKENIDEILERFKKNSYKIEDYWKSETGQNFSNNLKEYSNQFDYISNKLENYIRFLDGVIKTYNNENKLIENELDNNFN